MNNNNIKDFILITDDWHMNDGIVSTISMKYPINSKYESEPNKLFQKDNSSLPGLEFHH